MTSRFGSHIEYLLQTYDIHVLRLRSNLTQFGVF